MCLSGESVLSRAGLYSINDCPVKLNGVNLHVKHPSCPSCAYMFSYLIHVHAIGASEGGILLEIKRVQLDDQEANLELEVQPVEHGKLEEVVECPCHEPSRFAKGKPRSIITLLSILLKLEF